MPRHGYDYGFGAGWIRGERGLVRGDSRQYDDGWSRHPDAGWSRPDFDVSMGAFGGRLPEADYSFDGWGTYDTTGGNPGAEEAWRIGAPWGGFSGADRVRARELMTENPEVVTPDASLVEAARLMRDLDVGIVPVVADLDNHLLAGVITDRDIAIRAAAEGKDMNSSRVGDFMSHDVETVPEDATVREVFSVMKRERVRRVPVIDFAGRLVGIIAQADLAVGYAGLDTEREAEVEEVIERISEPARPRPRHRHGAPDEWPNLQRSRYDSGYDADPDGRLRHGWRTIKREARHLFHRGERQGYDRGWR